MKSQLLFFISVFLIAIDAVERGIAYIGESANFQSNKIWGSVVFDDNDDGTVTVTGNFYGLTPGEHGFHVHQYGDMRVTTDLSTLGFHFIVTCNDDPILNITCINDQQHGYPPALRRHPGDMGNITADSSGMITVSKVLGEGKMSLHDILRSIVGRTVLIHSGADLGVQPYGSAGGPEAFGVIGKFNIASNGATGPSATPVAAAIAVFTGLGSAGFAVEGSVWLVKDLGQTVITLLTNITGLPAGSYALQFFQYGHLSNDTMNYGTSIEAAVTLTSTGPTQIVMQTFTLTTVNVLTFVGGMSVLFSTPAPGAFQDVLAMGVVGLGNEAVAYPTASSANIIGYSSLIVFVGVHIALFFI